MSGAGRGVTPGAEPEAGRDESAAPGEPERARASSADNGAETPDAETPDAKVPDAKVPDAKVPDQAQAETSSTAQANRTADSSSTAQASRKTEPSNAEPGGKAEPGGNAEASWPAADGDSDTDAAADGQ